MKKKATMTAAVKRALEGRKATRSELEIQLAAARALIDNQKELIASLQDENRQLRAMQSESRLKSRAAAALSARGGRRVW